MNVWTFSGRCGGDAEVRKTQDGTAVVQFQVANDIGFGDRKTSQWVSCSWWGSRAEKVAQYIRKGDKLVVSGEVKLEEFKRRDGSPGSKMAVRVNDVDLAPQQEVDRSGDYNQDRPARPSKPSGKPTAHDDLNDEIPW